MRKFNKLSIRKKLLISMLAFSITLVVLVTLVAVNNTYDTMKEQLIYNRRMSIGWLQDRLSLELNNYLNQFYKFEVDRQLKTDIENWYEDSDGLDYVARLRLISAMNEAISMDSNMNTMELFNLGNDKVLLAERSGAQIVNAKERTRLWKDREANLQTNLIFLREEKEIVVGHQMYRFYDKVPIAFITMKLRPYKIQDILDEIKMTAEETIIILNDQNEIIEANYGEVTKVDLPLIKQITEQLSNSQTQEVYQNGQFWFYRAVNGGKLKILFSVPSSTIINSLSNTVLGGVTIGIIAVLVSIVGSIVFSKLFCKPIIELSKTMRTVTLDENLDVGNEKRQDEIGILHDSFNVMIERNQELLTKGYQRELEKREAQIRALQAQINPHFMYNILQVIGGMALVRKAPEIYQVTGALGDIMRYCLNFSRETVYLKEEIHYLQSYLMLQNQRFENRINFELDIPEELMQYQIPKLILQPVLENSFQHGLVNKEGSWAIQVEGKLIEGRDLLLIVSDNGIGMTEERLQEVQEVLNNDAEKALKTSAHIGLCNVDSRIRLKYPGENYGLNVSSIYGEGTVVRILMKAVKGDS